MIVRSLLRNVTLVLALVTLSLTIDIKGKYFVNLKHIIIIIVFPFFFFLVV